MAGDPASSKTRPAYWLAALAVVLMLSIGAVVLARGSGSPEVESRGPGQEAQDTSDAVAVVRSEPILIPTESDVVVFGGMAVKQGRLTFEMLSDGFLYSSKTPLPDSPLPPLYLPSGVATKGRIVIAGIDCATADGETSVSGVVCTPGTYAVAALSLETGEWQTVDLPDELRAVTNGTAKALGALEDGSTLWAITANGEVGKHVLAFWSLSPDLSTWQRLPDVEVPRLTDLCLSVDTIVGVVPAESAEMGSATPDGTRTQTVELWTLHRDDESWVKTPGTDLTFPAGGSVGMSCVGDAAVVSDTTFSTEIRTYGIGTSEWSPPIKSTGTVYAGRAVDDGRLVLLPIAGNEPVAVFEPGANAVIEGLPPGEPLVSAVAVGGKLIAHGEGSVSGEAGLVAIPLP